MPVGLKRSLVGFDRAAMATLLLTGELRTTEKKRASADLASPATVMPADGLVTGALSPFSLSDDATVNPCRRAGKRKNPGEVLPGFFA